MKGDELPKWLQDLESRTMKVKTAPAEGTESMTPGCGGIAPTVAETTEQQTDSDDKRDIQ